MKTTALLLILFAMTANIVAQNISKAWNPDLGNGKYKNPVLNADYSDPDVIRTGDDYWMTSSSFNCAPGLQILHSTDLVNWEIVNTVFQKQIPLERYGQMQHGNGVWAPCIRFHDGKYYIYWGDPDIGIFMSCTDDPRGHWSTPHLVCEGKGMIDTSPLWDDDGKAYLSHAWAGSRAGMKSILSIAEMSPDGKELIGEEVLVFDGHKGHSTVEGTKLYKRNGYYYIFAPAGGVSTGWQIVLRSKNIYGPYECRTVMHQGNTDINGPHQGGWVEDINGDCWFLHFQDKGAYGRVVHLQPMTWDKDDWCIIGIDQNGDGIGEPVMTYKKPASKVTSHNVNPADSDQFNGDKLGFQWQWQANPERYWYALNPSEGSIRLYCQLLPKNYRNLWDVPNLLLQKLVAEKQSVTAKVRFTSAYEGDRAGLIVMGQDYATLSARFNDGKIILSQTECYGAVNGAAEIVVSSTLVDADKELFLKAEIAEGAICRFYYSYDGRKFTETGKPFTAKKGQWIGAKTGVFATAEIKQNDGGWLDVDYFEVDK